jgi:hypothetical protein
MEWGILIAAVTMVGMLAVGISEATSAPAPRTERHEGKAKDSDLKKAA